MAEVNVENMEENARALRREKWDSLTTASGVELTDDQLVNFLLLCHQSMMGVGDDYEEEEMMEDDHHDDDNVKVKVMKVGSGDVHEVMNKILGG